MFTTNNNIFQMEQIASQEDAELTNDEHIDIELFSDNLDETFQTISERQNNGRRSRRIHRNVSSQGEIQSESRTRSDNDRVNSSETETNEQSQTNIIETGNNFTEIQDNDRAHFSETETNEQSQTNITETGNNFTEIQDNDRANSSETETSEQLQTNITETGNNFIEIQDESEIYEVVEDERIYEVPEDDYSYLNDSSPEDLPFHIVNWNPEETQSTSKEKSSADICTMCLVSERTHVFVPCGHLACCFSCINSFEANRCPICNVTYDHYIRIRKP